MEVEIARLAEENSSLESELLQFQAGDCPVITEEEINSWEQAVKKYFLEWRKRKRGCMDILDAISESTEIGRKELIN